MHRKENACRVPFYPRIRLRHLLPTHLVTPFLCINDSAPLEALRPPQADMLPAQAFSRYLVHLILPIQILGPVPLDRLIATLTQITHMLLGSSLHFDIIPASTTSDRRNQGPNSHHSPLMIVQPSHTIVYPPTP